MIENKKGPSNWFMGGSRYQKYHSDLRYFSHTARFIRLSPLIPGLVDSSKRDSFLEASTASKQSALPLLAASAGASVNPGTCSTRGAGLHCLRSDRSCRTLKGLPLGRAPPAPMARRTGQVIRLPTNSGNRVDHAAYRRRFVHGHISLAALPNDEVVRCCTERFAWALGPQRCRPRYIHVPRATSRSHRRVYSRSNATANLPLSLAC